MRKVALEEHFADGYIWTLIKLLCCVANGISSIGPLLGRHFSTDELSKATSTFTDLIRVDDDRCIDVRKLDGEFHELQDLNTRNHGQKNNGVQQQITYSAPEGEVCAIHDVDDVQLTDKDDVTNSTEEPEDSTLLEKKKENDEANKKE